MAENPTSSMVMKIITIAVVVIMISTVALPIIEDVQKSYIVTDNNTAQVYAATSGNDITISIVGGVVTVGTYVLPETGNSDPQIIAISDNMLLRHYAGMSTTCYLDSAGGTTEITAPITISSGVLSATSGLDDPLTLEGTIYYGASSGTHGLFKHDTVVNINANTELIVPLVGEIDSSYTVGIFKGKYNQLSQEFLITGGETATSSIVDMSSNVEYIDTEDYYKLTVDSRNVTISDGVDTFTGSWNGPVIAPLQYKHIDTDSSIVNLFGVVAILLVLVPVMLAVRMIALKRN